MIRLVWLTNLFFSLSLFLLISYPFFLYLLPSIFSLFSLISFFFFLISASDFFFSAHTICTLIFTIFCSTHVQCTTRNVRYRSAVGLAWHSIPMGLCIDISVEKFPFAQILLLSLSHYVLHTNKTWNFFSVHEVNLFILCHSHNHNGQFSLLHTPYTSTTVCIDCPCCLPSNVYLMVDGRRWGWIAVYVL